jgi:hypothetical protein
MFFVLRGKEPSMEEQKPGTFFGRNPVAVYLLAQSILGCVAAFGFNLSGDQIVAILTLVNVLIYIVANTMVMPMPVAQAKITEALHSDPPAEKSAAKGENA